MSGSGLRVAYGLASETGHRANNEDYGAVFVPEPPALARRGVVAAIADGVGGAPGGREAAETAVTTFIESYYAAPARLSPRDAAAEAALAANESVYRVGEETERLRGLCTTLSAIVIRGRLAHTVHVGDSRIYRMRDGALAQLTTDHNLGAQGFPHVLTRTVGASEGFAADQADHPVAAKDRFLLCTDGLCGVLSDTEIAAILAGERAPDAAAARLTTEALAAGSLDNVSALVLDVLANPGR
jgi:serine/threonine protein phosphatase PrpC